MLTQNALSEFEKIVGSAHVIRAEAELQAVETATFATSSKVLAILRPANAGEVAECVRAANRLVIPLYPVSRGRNYGYGSRCPIAAQSVLMDLGRMNRIVAFDAVMGTLTVEPGVTFEQAFGFLEDQGARFLLCGTGAPKDASLIGNALERGLGKGLAGNRIDHFCNLEVVLPTGEVFHTGMDRFVNARGASLTRGCAGPLLDHLFTQSNLGIVTQMSLWLTRIPTHFQSFVYTLKRPEQLAPVIDALRELRFQNVIRSTGTLFNDYRLLGFMGGYPWHAHDGSSSLPRPIARAALREKIRADAVWIGDGALFSQSAAQGRAERALIRRALRKHVSSLFFFDKTRVFVLDLALRLAKLFLRKDGPSPLDVYYRMSPYLGHPLPARSSLGSVYFRKRQPVPDFDKLDPDHDRCGVYWTGPIIPFCGDDVTRAVELAESTVSEHGYEPALSIQMASDRAVEIISSITYDRELTGEDEKARACHDALFREFVHHGYYPYRLGVQSQGLLPRSDDAYSLVIDKLKAALDPNSILALGRYDGKA